MLADCVPDWSLITLLATRPGPRSDVHACGRACFSGLRAGSASYAGNLRPSATLQIERAFEQLAERPGMASHERNHPREGDRRERRAHVAFR